MRLILISLLAGSALLDPLTTPAQAGFTLPPEMQGAGEEEKLRYLQRMSNRTMPGKTGLTQRRDAIASLGTNSADRSKANWGDITGARAAAQGSQPVSTLALLGLALGGGCYLVRVACRQFKTAEIAKSKESNSAA